MPRPARVAAVASALAVLLAPALAHAADAPRDTDIAWVLVSAALIFLMQAGFLALEVGFVRPKSATVTAMKNVADWSVVSVLWLLFGFGFAFGRDAGGLIGIDSFFGEGIGAPAGNGMGWAFFLFQLGFACTAVTIVSGAMAERVSFATYLTISVANGLLIFPVVAHWVWGNSFLTDQSTWLTRLGFHDFAGSTVVHSLGGWISLVGVAMIGPRLGRFDEHGKPRPIESYSLPLATLGVFLLWFGWWGFNGGSTLRLGDSTALVIVKTNIAASVGGLVAYLHARGLQRAQDIEGKFLGGVLTGLVAITACSAVVTLPGAIAIGALAGVVHNLAYVLLLRLRLDDPVGAVPVHLGGGLLGTVCVALFGRLDALHALTGVQNSRLEQLGVQLLGIAATAVWTVSISFVVLWVVRATLGLRVSPRQEAQGVSLAGDLHQPPPPLSMSEEELRKRLGG